MGKTISWTLKIDKLKKQTISNFCKEEGLVLSKFAEKALENEMEKRLMEKNVLVFKDYEKRKKGAITFEEAERRIKEGK